MGVGKQDGGVGDMQHEEVIVISDKEQTGEYEAGNRGEPGEGCVTTMGDIERGRGGDD